MLDKLRQNEAARLAVVTAALALLALVPLLGQFGFWDPQEINVADKARGLGLGGGLTGLWTRELPLTPWLVSLSTGILGRSELAARLPLALLGIVAALATYGLGARLRRPRAGLYAAIALLAGPLFVFQARQLTSDIGAVAGGALALLGLVGLTWPAGARRGPLLLALDAAAVAVGLLLGLLSAGLVMGAGVPLAATALTALFFLPGPRRTAAFGLAAATLVLAIVALVMLFDVTDAQPGTRAVLGKTLAGARGYLPWLGGAWRGGEAPVTASFDWVITQVAFGMFPWTALAPIAVLRLGMIATRDRQAWGGALIVAWATIAYLLASLMLRGLGELRFPALPALALACGVFLDDVLAAKLERDPARAADGVGFPVAAVFIFIAGFILSLDLRNFPDKLASAHLLGGGVVFPPALKPLVYATIGIGVAFSAAVASAAYVPGGDGDVRLWRLRVPRRALARHATTAALAVSFGFTLFLSWIYMPRLAQHFSHKNLFEAYFEHRRGSEPLAVMGIPGSGPEYYARGRFERIENVQRLLAFLGEPERAFAIVPSDRLCALHQNNPQQQVPYKVVDTRNSRFYLLTNQLVGNEKDLSPIASAFHREPPSSYKRNVTATWEDTVELLGVDMPDAVEKGEKFKITTWFRVKKRFDRNMKIFMHFDALGGSTRFHGDHEPVACNTTSWRVGDVIADTYTVTAAPEIAQPRGTYQLLMGFYSGEYRMPVSSGNKDSANRVILGNLRVR